MEITIHKMRKQKRFPMLITLPSLPAGCESYGKYTTPDTPLVKTPMHFFHIL